VSDIGDQAKERYKAALHAMQTGVALKMERDAHETQPKHLRVGVNSAMVADSAVVTLLVERGVFTWDEYFVALADAMEGEVALYRTELNLPPNVSLA
jgi:hypothetical protein